MFLNSPEYPFIKDLEDGAFEILKEYRLLSSSSLKSWHEKHLYNRDWKVFGFYAFGKRIEKNCAFCPDTVRRLEKIPGLMTAGFSILKPGTIIKPHRGYSGAVLRCHLGLVTPHGAAIRVAGETRSWKAGECLIFDDTSLHEAWNLGDSDRVVLLIDFLKPGHRLGLSDQLRNCFLRIFSPK